MYNLLGKQEITIENIKEQQEEWYKVFVEIINKQNNISGKKLDYENKEILHEDEFLDYCFEEFDNEKRNGKINIFNNFNTSNTMAFQTVIENKKEAINVINEALKILNENQLKNEEIKIVKNNYTSLKNLDGEACVLFQNTELKNIYYIIQIINKIDYKMSINIIECYYQTVRRLMIKEKCENKIPLIIPCIIYIGKEKWNAKRNIEEDGKQYKCFDLPAKKMNLGKYILMETNKIKDQELIKMNGILPKLVVIERAYKIENLMNIVNFIDFRKFGKDERNIINEYIFFKLCESYGKKRADIELEKLKKEEENLNFVDIINMQIYKEKKKARIEERKRIEKRMRENGISENIIKKIIGSKN